MFEAAVFLNGFRLRVPASSRRGGLFKNLKPISQNCGLSDFITFFFISFNPTTMSYIIPTPNGRVTRRSPHQAIAEIQACKKRVVSIRCEPKEWERLRFHAKHQWPEAAISYNSRTYIATFDFLPEEGNHDLDLAIRDVSAGTFAEGHVLQTEGRYYIWVQKTTIANQYSTGYLTARQIQGVIKDMKVGRVPSKKLSRLELLLNRLNLAAR